VGDQCTAGINFDPCRPRADIYKDYLQVVENIYTPEAYFARVLDVGRRLDSSKRLFRPGLRQWWKELKGFSRMARKLGFRRATARHFWGTLTKALFSNPKSVRYVGSLMALYLHFGPFAGYVAGKIREAIAFEERNPSKIAPPPPRPRCGSPSRFRSPALSPAAARIPDFTPSSPLWNSKAAAAPRAGQTRSDGTRPPAPESPTAIRDSQPHPRPSRFVPGIAEDEP